MRSIAVFATVWALTFYFATAARADIMWVVENQTNQVFRVNVNTLTATLVGPTGVSVGFGGLGFDASGTLYAWNTNPGNLYTVNQLTGAFTLVGGSSLFGADTFDISPTGDAIAWSVNGDLNDVNLANGSTTLRVNTSPYNAGIASAFGPDGTLYQTAFASPLKTVDIDTGIVTTIGPLGQSYSATNLGFNPNDGFLYQIAIGDANFPLYRINPATGAATLVGNITGFGNIGSNQQVTMATFQINAAEVPEPASLVLWTVVSVSALAGWRRRTRQSANLAA